MRSHVINPCGTASLNAKDVHAERPQKARAVPADGAIADDDGTLVDTLTTEQYGDTTGNAEQDSLHRFLGEAVDQLEANEQAVVVARWGLHNGPPLSRSEIADRLGVSREWVRQLERSALKKLKGQEGVQEAFMDYQQVSSV